MGALGAGALYVIFTLPPPAARPGDARTDPKVVFGGYHIHSSRSDGTGTPDEIAAAAARAGLRFVILTDHGDATRTPEPPRYLQGVLCIDAVEIGTLAGHVVALGLDRPAPYPLAGEPADVIDDLRRLGAWTVIAHPDSPKPELRWRGGTAPYDGLEWLNVDSEWRDESAAHLAGTVMRYFVRPPETIASLFRHPAQSLRRWDAAARARPVVGIAALDAHARVPWPNRREPSPDDTLAKLPSYEQMFKTLAQAAVLDRPLSGDAVPDSALVLSALRAGRAFSAVTAFAAPASLDFSATRNGSSIPMGESAGPAGSVASFQARVNDSAARVALMHNGVEIAAAYGNVVFTGPLTSGPYRVEAYRPGLAVPWIVSNPIFVEGPAGSSEAAISAAPPAIRLVSRPGASGWAIEKSRTSTGDVAAEGGATRFSYALGPGAASGQFAALVSSIDEALSTEGFDRVQFTVRADQPVRFSVQLRLPGAGDRRWRHSVYADGTPRAVVVNLQDFQPVNRQTSQRPIVAHVRSVLFVIDTLNTRPSTTGTLWLSDVALGVGKTER